ncbi:SPFH/Band 7/PHB domain protein [bacterium]|jgi:regulator of protease activity HflC (stomatin/prohibitin superfamily)|nr:SPFH/Band 7/PHB domain protein [bacterium]MBO7127885.1 SPFH/Band 7/PHB domain protein [bacterium]MBP5201679.1 SPFH/Band 7/PHB domain protein [bacterium]MBP5592333.1 SPFH/Band 7/PHB domain protein [bacterium]MBR4532317.1 SPFH/Band 7/PHB domain protein [bacterium]
MVWVIAVICVFAVIIIAKGAKIVPQAKVIIVERLGKYHCTLQSGFNIIVPIIDKPRKMETRVMKQLYDGRKIMVTTEQTFIDLRETVHDFPKQNVITKDNVVIEIDAILYYQITDPFKAMYEISNLPDAIEKLAKTTLRNIIGNMDLDHTLSSRDDINSKMTEILDEATDKWGVKVNRVEIQDINPPQDIKNAMEKQMRAERDKRAAILTAEADKQSKILESEGEKQKNINYAAGMKESNILEAEGQAQAKIKVATAEAESIRLIADAIKDTKMDPAQYLIALKYIETLASITSGKDNKVVYMPYEASGILGSVGSIQEMFKNLPK